MPSAQVAGYQAALARHRADILYDVPNSRVGANTLADVARACHTRATFQRFVNKGTCGANSTWPYRLEPSNRTDDAEKRDESDKSEES